MVRNPKQVGSNLFDCRPQTGKCPMDCNQCFYNRPNAFYVDINEPNIPTPAEVGDGIVRMNCGHDSNIQRDLVIETAKQYEKVFFNTSISQLDVFPAPVVYTANQEEEKPALLLFNPPANLMFVRLRVSTTNLLHIHTACHWYTGKKIPVVLTFMAYYEDDAVPNKKDYEWKKRHINSYWCPTTEFKMKVMRTFANPLVTMCGTLDSNWCRDCLNCETYYYQTMKRMKINGNDISASTP